MFAYLRPTEEDDDNKTQFYNFLVPEREEVIFLYFLFVKTNHIHSVAPYFFIRPQRVGLAQDFAMRISSGPLANQWCGFGFDADGECLVRLMAPAVP